MQIENTTTLLSLVRGEPAHAIEAWQPSTQFAPPLFNALLDWTDSDAPDYRSHRGQQCLLQLFAGRQVGNLRLRADLRFALGLFLDRAVVRRAHYRHAAQCLQHATRALTARPGFWPNQLWRLVECYSALADSGPDCVGLQITGYAPPLFPLDAAAARLYDWSGLFDVYNAVYETHAQA